MAFASSPRCRPVLLIARGIAANPYVRCRRLPVDCLPDEIGNLDPGFCRFLEFQQKQLTHDHSLIASCGGRNLPGSRTKNLALESQRGEPHSGTASCHEAHARSAAPPPTPPGAPDMPRAPPPQRAGSPYESPPPAHPRSPAGEVLWEAESAGRERSPMGPPALGAPPPATSRLPPPSARPPPRRRELPLRVAPRTTDSSRESLYFSAPFVLPDPGSKLLAPE